MRLLGSSDWDARAYLNQYYATTSIPDDSRAILTFIKEHLKGGYFESALEFGCGPALYASFVVAPHVGVMHFADYGAENLCEIRAWLHCRPGSFDWDNYARYAVELDGGVDVLRESVERRMQLLRERVGSLRTADVRSPNPTGKEEHHALVVSLFCIECVSGEVQAWETYFKNLASLVEPGGRLLLASLSKCTSYRVLGRRFDTAPVSETDVLRVLASPSLALEAKTLTSVRVSDWEAQGFDEILLLCADKEPQATFLC